MQNKKSEHIVLIYSLTGLLFIHFYQFFNKKFTYLYFANFAEKIDSRDEVERAPDRHRTNGYVEGGSEANKFRGQF